MNKNDVKKWLFVYLCDLLDMYKSTTDGGIFWIKDNNYIYYDIKKFCAENKDFLKFECISNTIYITIENYGLYLGTFEIKEKR